MIITDQDIGENAQYLLSLRGIHNVNNTFAVHPRSSSGHTAVEIRINDTKNLDYDVKDADKRSLVFEVVAGITNEYVSSMLLLHRCFINFYLPKFKCIFQNVVREVANSRVVVHLLDANDNSPVFASQSYHISVPEDTETNELVYNLTATDKDSGAYGTIRYHLKGFGAHKFKTDYWLGGIYTASTPLGRPPTANF